MKWSEDYATGIHRIDAQHKMLFKMAEDFGDALTDGHGDRVYNSFLESLNLYVRTHFRFEEGCMDKCHCPAAAGNKSAHERFTAMLKQYCERYAEDGYRAADARELTDTLESWLADHICRIDIQLRDSMYGEQRTPTISPTNG